MQTIVLTIPSISCQHCVRTINSEISDLNGVKSVDVDLNLKTATITYDAPATRELIIQCLRDIDYPPEE